MSGLYGLFKTNARAEEDGVWLEYDTDPKTRVRVSRAGGSNKKFQKRLEALTRPHRRVIQSDMMSSEKMRKITMQTFVDTVIVDWEIWDKETETWTQGIPGEDNAVLPFSKENVERVLTDLPDLFDDIMDYSQKSSLFKEEVLEAEAGN